VPDTRKHRGPHPEDRALFGAAVRPVLVEAVDHLSWLLSRNYAIPSALKLVGDRFQLTRRQRTALQRCACADASLAARRGKRIECSAVAGRAVHIDGYNLLTTVEAAMAGGVILHGRDGCLRDLASMHGSYRRVEETRPAILAVGGVLEAFGPGSVTWLLDSPVSNSGRLRALLLELAGERGWRWRVDLVSDPDRLLSDVDGIVVTSDSVILDRCRCWINLAREVVDREVPDAMRVELAPGGGTS
jgi:hypothetical protein